MSSAHDANETNEVRLDKWLWAARFFKTRSLAHEAIDGGKVHVNGHRAKASKTVKAGDELRIRTGFDERCIVVLAVSDKRGPATQAAALYEETPASIEKRLNEKELRRLNALAVPIPDYKPTKRDRRLLERLKRGE